MSNLSAAPGRRRRVPTPARSPVPDRTCNVLLELEQICGGPVVFLTPDAKPVLSPDQANRDTNATGGTSQTSLHQVMHAESAAKSDDVTLGRTLRTPDRVAALHL